MTIGNRIRKLRLMKQLTQKELSVQLGLTPKMISFYENNERVPPADILVKIAAIFQVSTDFLLGLSTDSSQLSDHKHLELNEDEYTLVTIYRSLERDYKDIIYGKLKEVAKLQELDRQSSRISGQKNRHNTLPPL